MTMILVAATDRFGGSNVPRLLAIHATELKGEGLVRLSLGPQDALC